jgi:hypothetical protein
LTLVPSKYYGNGIYYIPFGASRLALQRDIADFSIRNRLHYLTGSFVPTAISPASGPYGKKSLNDKVFDEYTRRTIKKYIDSIFSVIQNDEVYVKSNVSFIVSNREKFTVLT